MNVYVGEITIERAIQTQPGDRHCHRICRHRRRDGSKVSFSSGIVEMILVCKLNPDKPEKLDGESEDKPLRTKACIASTRPLGQPEIKTMSDRHCCPDCHAPYETCAVRKQVLNGPVIKYLRSDECKEKHGNQAG
jgi:hypothetical protein